MINYIIVAILLLFSALFSGLTLGLMGLNAHELKRKKSLGGKNAAKVYEVRKKGNLLLTTLLVGNVAINSALSIFLGTIASGVIAGLVATGLIVVFGEIAPQAVFSRFALKLGAKMAWLVKLFIYIFYPISWPIAWVLDKTLGKELSTIYSKQELVKIIEEHESDNLSDVDEDEERIVKGALTFSDKEVKEVMTPSTVVIALAANKVIDTELLKQLRKSSHTRIPVYEGKRDKIIGILFLKQLIGKLNIGKTVGEVARKKIHFVEREDRLDKVFNKFIKKRHHLFVVRDEFGAMNGIITLEDILEEIIKDEIVDEADKHPDMRKLARQMAELDKPNK